MPGASIGLAEADVFREEARILGVLPIAPFWPRLSDALGRAIAEGQAAPVSILCESDNMLFEHSFLTDTEYSQPRVSYTELRFLRDSIVAEVESLAAAAEVEAPVTCEIQYLRMPFHAIQSGDRLFVSDWLITGKSRYEEVPLGSDRHTPVLVCLDRLFDEKIGRKYAARPGMEALQLYDHQRIPRGIFPRTSFYDTDFSQLVVWGFVFDRKGRLLIHRRSDNAKDNRSMWDKSVGGHVDFAFDTDTSRAIARELVEELFTDEVGRADWPVAVDDRSVIFLGDWRPSRRRGAPFRELRHFDREWSFFRLPNSQQVYSPRTLPDNSVWRLRTISDLFLFVAGPEFCDQSLGALFNSEFKLVELGELKTAIDRALRGERVRGFDEGSQIPKFSPDLVNVMTGQLRDTLEEFAQHIKRYLQT